jgi:ABC-type phosphate transport system permease subunit
MAYTSTLLLLAIVVALNAAAIGLRSRLRKRYSVAAA